MSIVKVSDIRIHSDDRKHLLLDSCSFDLAAGEVLAIIGPNGAGKSSLLKALAGDIEASGAIDFIGFSDDQLLRARQIAVLPQQSPLSFPFTVEQVVGLSRIPHASGHKLDSEIIDKALEKLDIHYLKQRQYTELSGGEKQRVQLARVFAQVWREQDADGPRLLLLDEPTSSLDLGHQHQLMQSIRSIAEQGVGVIVILHDINLASLYADKILALLCSQTISFGKPAEVLNASNIKKLFDIDVDIIQHPESLRPMVSARSFPGTAAD